MEIWVISSSDLFFVSTGVTPGSSTQTSGAFGQTKIIVLVILCVPLWQKGNKVAVWSFWVIDSLLTEESDYQSALIWPKFSKLPLERQSEIMAS